MRTMVVVAAMAISAAAYAAWAQTPQGFGAPTWSMGYRTDLGVWHGLKLDMSDNLVTTTNRGVGSLTAVPAASTNGTALGTMPTGATGVRLYLPAGASVTFTIASTAPASAPSATFTVSASGTGPNWDESLAAGEMIYVTAVTGSPLFRWN